MIVEAVNDLHRDRVLKDPGDVRGSYLEVITNKIITTYKVDMETVKQGVKSTLKVILKKPARLIFNLYFWSYFHHF